jgi:hypothetical protein
MPKQDPTFIAISMTLFVGLFAAFGPAVFMFQSRHHSIDDHERKLQQRYEELFKDNSDDDYRQNIWDQIAIVRKRYDAALWAFILLMTQEIILIIAIVIVAIYHKIIFWHLAFLILPGVIAFGLHIFGDLRLAFKTQTESRAWLSNKKLPVVLQSENVGVLMNSNDNRQNFLAVLGVALAGVIQVSSSEGAFTYWNLIIGIVLCLVLWQYPISNNTPSSEQIALASTWGFTIVSGAGLIFQELYRWANYTWWKSLPDFDEVSKEAPSLYYFILWIITSVIVWFILDKIKRKSN